ncbi:MAG: glycosyltransferase family 9 protein [Candidatus Omnitrophica bacterium]|nr:glycosyltransferase family 9 protein [Candidatus Omnitrophota bacterium]
MTILKSKILKNILVIRNDRFGEFLLNIPALRAIKETYPSARITAVVSPQVKELALMTGFIDQIFEWDKNKIPSKFELISWLRKNKFDAALMLNPSKDFNLCAFLAGVPIRAGYDRKLGFLLTHKIKDTKDSGLKHEVEYNLDLAGLIGAKTGDKSLSLARLPAHNGPEYAGSVALHPYTSDPVKQWPLERSRELAKRISDELGLPVLIVGKDKGSSGKEFEGLGRNIINLVNKTTLAELAQILRKCRLLISCDSGPMHLAAAVGTPVIALFRNDLPGKTARRWGPWGKSHIIIEKNKLTDISVEEVVKQVKELPVK